LVNHTKQAFVAELEKSHGSALRRYLAARMRNPAADVQDLVQEVFLRMLRVDNHALFGMPLWPLDDSRSTDNSIFGSFEHAYTIGARIIRQRPLSDGEYRWSRDLLPRSRQCESSDHSSAAWFPDLVTHVP
jgi:hypothetical protein